MARELIILPRFKRDYRNARKHAEFDVETLEYVFDALITSENSHRPCVNIALESAAITGVASRSATWGPIFSSSIGSVGARWSCIASGRTHSCSVRRAVAILSRRGARAKRNKLPAWDNSGTVRS